MDSSGFRYLAGVEVSSPDGLPPGFTTVSLPAQQYAVFTYHGHVSGLREFGKAIWSEWLPGSGHEVVDSPVLMERYDQRFDPSTASGDVEVWLPIKR